VLVPVALIAALVGAPPLVVFILSALAMIPLAGVLGQATEELATHAGPRVGGLLNATFGNAAELIITIVALREGLIEVVKASITGSIIGNLLLVLGFSLLLGGLKNGIQRFGRRAAGTSVTMFTLAVIGLVIPAAFSHAIEIGNSDAVEYLSIGVAVVLIILYFLSVVFSFTSQAKEDIGAALPGDEVKHHARWSLRLAVGILFVSTLAVVILSEVLVGAIEPVVATLGLTEFFLGIIIIPIIGNVAEHLVGVQAAMRNRMELSLGISLGSSLQIALFVAPVLVFVSLIVGHPMSLVFNLFELAALGTSVAIAGLIALDGESNWLEGAQLLAVYSIIALAFFYLPA